MTRTHQERRYAFIAFAVALLLIEAACTRTVSVPLTNSSFELGTFVNDGKGTMILQVGATDITGWTVVTDELAWIGNPNPWSLSAQEGDRFLDLTAYPAGAPFGAITQTVETIPQHQYELSYYLGSHTARWGGPPVAIVATAGGESQTCTVTSRSSGSTWTPCTMAFTATSASTVISLAGKEGAAYIGLDNVMVQTAETAWWPLLLVILLIIALIIIGIQRRRRPEIGRPEIGDREQMH